MAHELGVDPEKIPTIKVDVRTKHVLAVSECIDALGMDGETEVKVTSPNGRVRVIADAVCYLPEKPNTPIYLEVDLSNNVLRRKALRYTYVNPPLLIIVTHRPHVVQEAFKDTQINTIIIPRNLIHDERIRQKFQNKVKIA